MKIIQLIYSLSSGGAERFVVSLSNQLADMGHQVTICMLLSDNEERYIFNRQFVKPNVSVHSLGFSVGFSLSKMSALENYISSENPDVVHCHLNVIPYIFKTAINNKKRIRFIHTLHNVAESASGKKWQRGINHYYYSRNLIIPVTISDKCKDSFEKYYGLKSPNRIDNGCEKPVKTPNYEEVLAEVNALKKNIDTPVFIHVARFHKQKNQAMLIDVFNRLYDEGQDFVLLIIGDGFSKSEGAELKAKACKQIHFLGLRNNVSDFLYCSDAFCLSSIYEGLPISLLEAMACGVLPICTNVGGVPDVIEHGVTGLLSNVSPDEYYKVIRSYFNVKIEKTKLIEQFENHYSIRKCAERYMNIYIQ